MWLHASPTAVMAVFSSLLSEHSDKESLLKAAKLVRDILARCPGLFASRVFMVELLKLSMAESSLARSFYDALLEDKQGYFKDVSPEKLSSMIACGLKIFQKEGYKSGNGFLTLESGEGIDYITSLYERYPLEMATKRLGFYSVGLTGRDDVEISPASESPFAEVHGEYSFCTDGQTIYLPDSINIFSRNDLNYLIFKTGLAHEIGHIELGTFGLQAGKIKDVVAMLNRKYPGALQQNAGVYTASTEFDRRWKLRELSELSDYEVFLNLFPVVPVAREIFNLIEDTRIDRILCLKFPGLKDDYQWINELVWPRRPCLGSMNDLAQVFEVLLQFTIWGRTREPVPPEVQALVEKVIVYVKKVQESGTTVKDSARATALIYIVLNRYFDFKEYVTVIEIIGKNRMPYRGEHRPDQVRRIRKDRMSFSLRDKKKRKKDPKAPAGSGKDRMIRTSHKAKRKKYARKKLEQQRENRKGIFTYDEWDHSTSHYRRDYCVVIDDEPNNDLYLTHGVYPCFFCDTSFRDQGCLEEQDEPSIPIRYDVILRKHRGYIHDLRKRLEYVKPERMRLVNGFEDGEVIDIDRAVNAVTDMRRGVVPDDRIFYRLVRKSREVAVLLLVDVSNSTGNEVDSSRKIIDVEVESLVLISESMKQIGDTFSIYAFSSNGNEKVNMIRCKHFDEELDRGVKDRIGNLFPLSYTRMGAAIRHATYLLGAREEKTKILMVLTDGFPYYMETLDKMYDVADVRKAVFEARSRRINVFGISVDKESIEYLPQIFGENDYRIIMKVENLPMRLAELYLKLAG